MGELKLKVHNMKCSGCSGIIETHLKKVGGVSNVSINLPDKIITVYYNGDNSIRNLVINTLKGIGYPGEEL
jgi:copper chaperone CopZ